MLSPGLIQGRAPQLRVFFPPNDDLRPSNAILDRATIVLLGPRDRATTFVLLIYDHNEISHEILLLLKNRTRFIYHHFIKGIGIFLFEIKKNL